MAVVDGEHAIFGRHAKIGMDKKRVVIGSSDPGVRFDRVRLKRVEMKGRWADYVRENFTPKSWSLKAFWAMREERGLKR